MIVQTKTDVMKIKQLISLYLLSIFHNRFVRSRFLILAGVTLPFAFACSDDNRIHTDPVEFKWTFNAGSEGWTGDFADYPVGEEETYQLYFGYDSLPLPLDDSQGALLLSGNNHNNNLFMFVKKRITVLKPNTVYYATFTIEIATNEPGNELNAATVPGGQIYIGAGATPVEPRKVVEESNLYGLNIGKCDENKDGEDMVVMGNIVNDADEPVYTLKTITNEKPFHCVTNEKGELWIIVAVDSGVSTTTEVYYNSIQVNLF